MVLRFLCLIRDGNMQLWPVWTHVIYWFIFDVTVRLVWMWVFRAIALRLDMSHVRSKSGKLGSFHSPPLLRAPMYVSIIVYFLFEGAAIRLQVDEWLFWVLWVQPVRWGVILSWTSTGGEVWFWVQSVRRGVILSLNIKEGGSFVFNL